MHLLTDKNNTCGIKYLNKMNFSNALFKVSFNFQRVNHQYVDS